MADRLELDALALNALMYPRCSTLGFRLHGRVQEQYEQGKVDRTGEAAGPVRHLRVRLESGPGGDLMLVGEDGRPNAARAPLRSPMT